MQQFMKRPKKESKLGEREATHIVWAFWLTLDQHCQATVRGTSFTGPVRDPCRWALLVSEQLAVISKWCLIYDRVPL